MLYITHKERMFLTFVIIYSLIPTFGGLLRSIELIGVPAIIPENPRAGAAPIPIILHILSSFIFCIMGVFQFLPSVRHHRISWHRMIGTLVAGSGLLSALTGLWMTITFAFPEALQGTVLFWVRVIVSLSMVGLIVWAVISIRQGQLPSHRAAMIRCFALGQGASTQTFLGIGWMVFGGSEPTGLARDLLMTSAWILNVLIAELLIAKHESGHRQTIF